jgi:lycopene cyclase domain-containing protein
MRFYSKIKPLLISLLVVGIFFVGWDVFATYRGHWAFNPSYVHEMRFWGLPVEELLFFLTVPYSCIFVFDSISYFFEDSKLFTLRKRLSLGLGVLITFSAFSFFSREYTFLAVLSVGLTVLFVSLVNLELFCSKSYWTYVGLTLVLFAIFNYLLTSLPVVQYSSNAITGFRVITIPIEDFLFNFSMLTNYLTVYLWASKNWETE